MSGRPIGMWCRSKFWQFLVGEHHSSSFAKLGMNLPICFGTTTIIILMKKHALSWCSMYLCILYRSHTNVRNYVCSTGKIITRVSLFAFLFLLLFCFSRYTDILYKSQFPTRSRLWAVTSVLFFSAVFMRTWPSSTKPHLGPCAGSLVLVVPTAADITALAS